VYLPQGLHLFHETLTAMLRDNKTTKGLFGPLFYWKPVTD
jgi:hypothetical protein